MARIKPQTLLQQSKKKKGPTRISLTTIIFCNLIVILLILSLVTSYRYYTQRSSNFADKDSTDPTEEDGINESGRFQVPNYAILETSKGSITVELFKEASPEILNKFIKMCKKGHFKGLPFHRVIKNYIIKAGDYQRLGPEEDWILKVKPQNQLVMSSKHEAFMIGTSKATRTNKGFDIFITTAPIPDLNDKLVVFGQVTKGEDVVQEIEEVDTDKDYRPKSNIGILNINLKQEK